MTDISTEVTGLKVRSPAMLAAGVLGTTGTSLRRIAVSGAGAVVTKSLGVQPSEGHPGPNLVEVDCGFLNAMGLPNPSCAAFLDEMDAAREAGVPIIASVIGRNAEEFSGAARLMGGADALELNVSCPHAERGYGASICSDPDLLADIVRSVKGSVKIPVWVKLPPYVDKITELGIISEKNGADAVVAINTVPAMAIDINTGMPILGNITGGLSGPAIKPISLKCTYDLYKALKIPVISVGGIAGWEDAVEFIMAGAAAVQVGSALHNNIDIFREIETGIKAYLEEKGMTLEAMRGIAHRKT